MTNMQLDEKLNDNVIWTSYGNYTTRLKKLKGFNTETVEFIQMPADEDPQYIYKTYRNEEFVVGVYLPNRNLIYVYPDVFDGDKYQEKGNEEYVYEIMQIVLDYIEENKIKSKDMSGKIIEVFTKEFMSGIKTRLKSIEDTIKSKDKDIDNYQKEITKIYNQVLIATKEKEGLEKFDGDTSKLIPTQIERIKEFPFVKDVKLENTSLLVSVGEVKVKHGKHDLLFGDYDILITPTTFKVVNKNPIYEKEGMDTNYKHPHISSNMCTGGRDKEIRKFLAEFKFDKVVFSIYAFLKRLVDNDTLVNYQHWINPIEKDGLRYSKYAEMGYSSSFAEDEE